MDVRNVLEVEPEVEHNGTVPVWWLIKPREVKDITDGGSLQPANEFEVAVGGEVFPHTHPTHEFYFVMTGAGVMTIAGESRDVSPGDLIYIPPDEVHSLRSTVPSLSRWRRAGPQHSAMWWPIRLTTSSRGQPSPRPTRPAPAKAGV